MSLQSTGLFLLENQVHIGMTVALAWEGKGVPGSGEEEAVVKCLTGGVPARKLYLPVESIIFSHGPNSVNGRPGSVQASAIDPDSFLPEVRFMPIEAFSAETVPANTECVVFLNGERLTYGPDKMGYTVAVYKDESGTIISTGGTEQGVRQSPFPLSDGAVLIPVGAIGGYKRPTSRAFAGPRRHWR